MFYLNKRQADELIEHSKRELPNEACGILAGKNSRVEKIYSMSNKDKSPISYFMDPQEQLRVIKEIRNSGLEMIGIYHSHVTSQAYPSARDVEMAFYPEVSYVIISLSDRRNPVLRSFKIVEGKITGEPLEIE